jgi:hypothetical protein
VDSAARAVGLASYGGTVTHCKRGHPRSAENTDKRGNCRPCINLLAEARRRTRGQRPIHERSTVCPRGHVRTPENTTPIGACRVCKAITDRQRKLAIGKMLRIRISTGYEVLCSRGHVLTLDKVDKYGACLHCKHDHNVSQSPRPSGSRKGRAPYRLSERCKNGHKRTAKNTYITPQGYRACRICQRKVQKRARVLRAPDPLGLTLRNESGRIRKAAQRRAAGIPERKWSAKTLAKRQTRLRSREGAPLRVPCGPFLAWLDDYLAVNPAVTMAQLARCADSSERTIWSMQNGEYAGMNLDIVDRFIQAAGESPAVLMSLYPLVVAA